MGKGKRSIGMPELLVRCGEMAGSAGSAIIFSVGFESSISGSM
jgi:hypothetical protein